MQNISRLRVLTFPLQPSQRCPRMLGPLAIELRPSGRVNTDSQTARFSATRLGPLALHTSMQGYLLSDKPC